MITIYYGVPNRYTNVTHIAKVKLLRSGIITIPAGDGNRASIFGYPVPNVGKHIKVVTGDEPQIYEESVVVKIFVSHPSQLFTSYIEPV
jgi:hypothetical protein